MKRIAIVVSSPITVRAFLTEQIAALSRVYRVSLLVNLETEKTPKGEMFPNLPSGVEIISAPIVRNISALHDLRGLFFLAALFSRGRFDAVHSFTPKAGLLTALAGAIARVPVRIHTFTGQVWATRSGLARQALKAMDQALARLTTDVLVDSPSQRDFLAGEGILSAGKARVLANGSICGVDTSRFCPNPAAREKLRRLHGIPEEAVVFLFIGRLKIDKGVLDLARAFARLEGKVGGAWLLMAGPDEERLQPRIEELCGEARGRLRVVGITDAPQEYMAASDVLCLPSYREGFGSVIIEAAACGLPGIGSKIYGITDAIEPNVTGLLHAPGDVEALLTEMRRMIGEAALREALGGEARLRAHRLFARDLVTSALLEFYGSVVR